MTHEQLIKAAFEWHWNSFPDERRMLYGVNNNSTNSFEGNKNKSLGVVRGVLDLCYILPKQVVYFDAKVGNDTLSLEQTDFIAKCEDRGIMCFTFSTLKEFQELIGFLQTTFYI